MTYVALADDQEGKASDSETASPPPTEDPSSRRAGPSQARRKEARKEARSRRKKPFEVVPLPNLPLVDQDQFPDEQDNPEARFMAQNNHRAAEDVQARIARSTRLRRRRLKSPRRRIPLCHPLHRLRRRWRRLLHRLRSSLQPTSGQAGRRWLCAGLPASCRARRCRKTKGHHRRRGHAVQPAGRAGGPADEPQPAGPEELAVRPNRRSGEVAETVSAAWGAGRATASPNRWDRLLEKQNMIRGALENFLPHVRVGNQSELGTRKHPFAAFIATMHRQIHRYWGDGFLADLDRKTGRDAYRIAGVGDRDRGAQRRRA